MPNNNPPKALRKKFGFWILYGLIGFAVLTLLGQWRLSFCKPPHDVRTASGYEDPAKDYRRSAQFVFVAAGDKKTESDKNKTAEREPYYLPEILCGEIKLTDLLIALFTYYLVVVGWFTMRSADENTKSAERAYLVAGPLFGVPKVIHPEGSIEEWQMRKRALKSMFTGPWRMAIINFGKTAAYPTKVEWGVCPRDEFPDDILVSDLLDDPKHATWRALHIKGIVTTQDIFSPNPDDPLHYRHVVISDEDRQRYIGSVFFGRITYKDVFKDEHFTTFSYHMIEEHSNSIGKSLSDDHS